MTITAPRPFKNGDNTVAGTYTWDDVAKVIALTITTGALDTTATETLKRSLMAQHL
jgi:hypothetical protein